MGAVEVSTLEVGLRIAGEAARSEPASSGDADSLYMSFYTACSGCLNGSSTIRAEARPWRDIHPTRSEPVRHDPSTREPEKPHSAGFQRYLHVLRSNEPYQCVSRI